MTEYKSLFPFQYQKINLRIRGLAEAVMENSDDTNQESHILQLVLDYHYPFYPSLTLTTKLWKIKNDIISIHHFVYYTDGFYKWI